MSGETPTGPQRRIDRLLEAYDAAHRSRVNVAVQVITVPVMTWCVLAFLSAMPFPDALKFLPGLSWGLVGAAALSLYYLTLSRTLAVGVALGCLLALIVAAIVARTNDTPLWQVALFIYVLAWVAQIGGYRLEERPPTFAEDARFLLIGPAWLLAGLYRRLGIRV
jgi:uncharacterized membrane protein YGL010W